MKRLVLSLITAAVLCSIATAGAAAAPVDPKAAKDVVNALGARILETVTAPQTDPARQHAEIACAFGRAGDFTAFSRQVLGRNARRLNDQRLRRFADLFQSYAAQLALVQLVTLRAQDFRIDGHKVGPNGDLIVGMDVDTATSGQPLRLGFRMRDLGQGPKVIDLLAENSSAAIYFYGEFDRRARGNVTRMVEILQNSVETVPDCSVRLENPSTARR